MRFQLTCALGALFLALPSHAAEDRPKVAIKTFQNPTVAAHSTIGEGLTDILTTELQNTGKFTVLERTNVDELTKEMSFADSEFAKSSSFAKKGSLLGAQYLLMGKVSTFSYNERVERQNKVNLFGPNTIETIFHQQAEVRVDFRLIDIESGETIISQAGEARETNTSKVSEYPEFSGLLRGAASVTLEGTSSLIGRATTGAAKDIVRKLNALANTVRERGVGNALNASLENLANAKGQLVADEGGGLWIIGGIGRADGLQKGDRLKLTHENVVKDNAGKVVYRKPMEIGSMEVTDVSQGDHAEVQYLQSPTGGAAKPQANDIVSVDMEYARARRNGNMGAPPSVVISSPPSISSVAPAAANNRVEQILKRADGYMTDRFWSQALDEYRQAAAINPNEPRVLQGEAIAHYMMGDFIEGDESAGRALETGASLSTPVAHYHSMGLCTGELSVQPGKLAFKTDKGDGFEIAPGNLAGITIHRLRQPFIANEKTPDWPVLEIRWRDASGHEKKYEMLPYIYSKQQSLSGKNLASAFSMDDSDVREMQKFEQSLVTLIQKYLK